MEARRKKDEQNVTSETMDTGDCNIPQIESQTPLFDDSTNENSKTAEPESQKKRKFSGSDDDSLHCECAHKKQKTLISELIQTIKDERIETKRDMDELREKCLALTKKCGEMTEELQNERKKRSEKEKQYNV